MPITLALWRPRQEDLEFKVILAYIVKPCLKNQNTTTAKKPFLFLSGRAWWGASVVPATWEAETGESLEHSSSVPA
jgi:hypothetical protein